MPGDEFTGTLDAVAQFGPAAAVMFAQVTQQGGPFVGRERPEIGPAHGCGRDRDTGTDVELDAERLSVTALAEIDHAVAVAPADRTAPPVSRITCSRNGSDKCRTPRLASAA